MKSKKLIAGLLVALMTVSLVLAGCSNKNKDMVYAVEKGSAGEEVALEKGFKVNSVGSQADALMEVNSGNSDAAIIDLLMAGAMIGEGTSYPSLKYTDSLNSEEYGVGCRKGSDLASYINAFFSEIYTDGTMKTLAEKYGTQEALVEQAKDVKYTEGDGDVKYIQGKGKLVVGITEFEPMDYKDDSGNWIGFDADMCNLLGKKLGVTVEFVEIDWDNKDMELSSKNIDVVWNGMTINDAVKESMEVSNPYCKNAQVIVIKSN